jgi:hypothetical protein
MHARDQWLKLQRFKQPAVKEAPQHSKKENEDESDIMLYTSGRRFGMVLLCDANDFGCS